TRLGAKVTVEQTAALLGDLATAPHFTKQYAKRENALYQNLFLNRRLRNPLDPAFALDPSTGDIVAGQTTGAHKSAILSAINVRESDLALLEGLTKPAGGSLYIDDDLTLANLSFLWR